MFPSLEHACAALRHGTRQSKRVVIGGVSTLNPRRASTSLVFVTVLSTWLGLCASAGAGGPGPARAVDRAPDTFVNDSFEAGEWLSRLSLLEQSGKWAEASHLVDRLYTAHGRRLVPAGPGIYESVSRRLNHIVGGWPAAGLRVYRGLFDGVAALAFRTAVAQRDVDGLLEVLDHYFATTVASQIADWAVELALESGDFATARRVAVRMLEEHPDGGLMASRFAGYLAVIAAADGNEAEAERWLTGPGDITERSTIRWMGRDEPLVALVRTLVSQVRAQQDVVGSGGWPVFGGDGSRNATGSFVLDRLALLWRFDGFAEGSLDGSRGDAESSTSRHARKTGKFLVLNPVAGDGVVFLQDADDVWALELATGTRLWHYSDRAGELGRRGVEDGSGTAWHAATLAGQRLYACLGRETVSYYGFESSGGGGAVVCLEARTGERLWRVDPLGRGASYGRVSYGSSPLVSAGSVYVVARRRRTFGFEDCYLLRLRASDGELVYQTHLGGASTGGFGYRRSTLSFPALVDGTVYVATNLGTVGAVTAQTEKVRWLRLYDREPESDWRTGSGTASRDVRPWHYNAVLSAGDRLICVPADAPAVLVLNRGDGQLEQVIETERMDGVRTLLGVRGDRLYGLGTGVFCFDLAAGELVWRSPLPDGARVHGRGTIAGGRVLIPTDSGLCGYALDTGRLARHGWERPDASGNLVAIDNRLVVAGNDHVSVYERRTDVWARLRGRMAARPDDPVPALDLCEIAFQSGDREEAVQLLEAAIERSGGFTGLATEDVRHRLFATCLRFAREWPVGTPAERGLVERLFRYSSQCAPDRMGHLRYRFLYAEHLTTIGEAARAVTLYQQILNDRSLRETPWDDGGRKEAAGELARARIERAIREHGRAIYAAYDAEASAWFKAARTSKDVGLLDRILVTRPAALLAADAMVLKGDLLLRRGEPIAAARVLTSVVHRFGDRGDGARLMRKIADCYVSAGQPASAWRWLTRALQEYPEARVEERGRSVSLRTYRRRLAAAWDSSAVRRPRIGHPIRHRFERSFDHDVSVLEPVVPPTPDSNWEHVYVWGDGRLHAFDARSGAPVWSEPARCPRRPELLLATDRRVVLATAHRLMALDRGDGSVVWSAGERPADMAAPGTDPESFASFYGHAYHQGRLVSLVDDGRSVCAEIDTGRMVWQRRLRHRPTSGPAFSGRRIAYRGIVDGSTGYCILDAGTGELLQTVQPESDDQLLRMHWTVDGKLIIVHSRSLYAFDPETGQCLWRRMEEDNIIDATVAFDVDAMYLSLDGARVTKVSFDNGSTIWKSEPLFSDEVYAAQTILRDGQLMLLTERGLSSVDTISGRRPTDAEILPGVTFRHRFVAATQIVAIDAPSPDHGGVYTAYFLGPAAATRPKSELRLTELGTFDDVRRVVLRDGAVVLQVGRTIHGWASVGE